ncbi:hypothetical protein M422DRAFT_256542 [Sphaerobolus stellatus SS14]|uniref:CCL2-like lectin domain-containing protein n=1 Tax=Sphaerobolus stellatus (strain SS14) TaxID=990650 RepID=A0A0C9V0D9_SPHS4|nr:hypothetical protein M422DRAFT_256542 [Sphaerobolus stellatus SS14]
MSKPSAGTYILYLRVLSPSGAKLALTWKSSDNTVNLEPLTGDGSQKWSIKDYNATTQSISPSNDANKQIGFGNGGLSVLPSGGYVFQFRSSDSGYTISDGAASVFWQADNAVDHVRVTTGGKSTDEKQRWILEKQ